ncbi:MAG: BACON domain-containing protein, partial [Bacteroidales bacterium]|nr:BACON domain-containing protein [Bacteroidales bacterium]
MKKVLICAFVALLTLGSCQTVKLAKEIVLPVTTKTVSGQSQDFKMKVTADGKWDLAVDKTAAEWLSVTPETGNEGETVITVSVKSNL